MDRAEFQRYIDNALQAGNIAAEAMRAATAQVATTTATFETITTTATTTGDNWQQYWVNPATWEYNPTVTFRVDTAEINHFNKIFYEMKKRYNLRTAKEWLETEYNGGFYLHDASTSTYLPYCFSGDTKIMTKNGLRRLDELNGMEISVLNKNRGWENAIVKCFGRQELRKLTLTRYGVDKSFLVTGNHKWFVIKDNGGTIELDTNQLKSGMRIPFNVAKTWSDVEPSPFGVAHGFFTGDGDKGEHKRVNFCGDKEALIPY